MKLNGVLALLLALCLLTFAPLALAEEGDAEAWEEISIEAVDPSQGEATLDLDDSEESILNESFTPPPGIFGDR